MFLERIFEALEDLDGLADRRLERCQFSESAGPARGLSRRFPGTPGRLLSRYSAARRRQHGLDQVRGIHDAARSRTGTDYRVNLIDEQDCAGLSLESRHAF